MRFLLSLCIWLCLTLAARAQSETLPCTSATVECVALLSDQAVTDSPELRTLDQAIEYQRRRGWSSRMNADGLNPVAVVFRVARNVVGGGDVAANKLDVAQLERRRAEVESALRLQVANGLAEIEATRRRHELARAKWATHEARMKLAAAGYRLGDSSTEESLAMWQAGVDLRAQTEQAEDSLIVALVGARRDLIRWK